MSRPNLAPVPRAVVRRLDNAPADQQAAWSALWATLLRPSPHSKRATTVGNLSADPERSRVR